MVQIRKHYACATSSSVPADQFHTETGGLFRVYVIPLRDYVPEWNSRPGTRTGVNSRRGYSRRHDILWWYHVNNYRAMRGNRSELALGRNSPQCHVNTPPVRNLGVLFDRNLKFDAQITKTCCAGYYYLYNIRKIRKYLTLDSNRCLVHTLVMGRVDYCNRFTLRSPNK